MQDEGAGIFSTQPLAYSKLEEIKAVPGVAEVQGEIGTLLDPEAGMSFGMPSMLAGSDMRGDGLRELQDLLLPGPGPATGRDRVVRGRLRLGQEARRQGGRAR